VGRAAVTVLEADESDGSFLAYRPTVAVVTNVEPDHLDHYHHVEAVTAAFADFAATIRPGGTLIACADDDGAAQVAARARAGGLAVMTYGFGPTAEVRVSEVRENGWAGTLIQIDQPGRAQQRILLPLPGRHNALNATAAFLVTLAVLERRPQVRVSANVARANGEGSAGAFVASGLERFAGTGRRFETRGEAAGVLVIDDYAHHPTEVAATLAAARRTVGEGRILAVFQPHLYSRTEAFAEGFAAALAAADAVAVMDVYAAREEPRPGVDGGLIAARAPGATYLPRRHDVPEWVADHARPGDLVLTLGAGDLTELAPEILAAISRRHPEPRGTG
jgi:UDP-N-acetylmuramate--alanine ligase